MSYIFTGKDSYVRLQDQPDECPYCHNKIIPENIFGFRVGNDLHALQHCPNQECTESFISYYYQTTGDSFSFIGRTTFGSLTGKTFNDDIVKISPSFTLIYNQAYSAEQQNLTEICGVGYRKALEFLIKDYSILNNPLLKEKIEKQALAQCIKDYVDDGRIKAVATRAVWLGNDETHYIRKWEGKNLEDLKKLIDLTVHWIEMETLTKSFEIDMPE